ncbi:MAG: hypothetical protein QGH20_02025 [Candidatus Latescibacteria bacterium]|jgi:hypothetical protein|nr:hypothetical protein [Candidatus Latescibacterota bacterium]
MCSRLSTFTVLAVLVMVVAPLNVGARQETGTIAGTVHDRQTDEPLPGISVRRKPLRPWSQMEGYFLSYRLGWAGGPDLRRILICPA